MAGCSAPPQPTAHCLPGATSVTLPESRLERTDPRSTTDPITASDLFCFKLFPTPAGGGAGGIVRILRPWSPFGVSVTASGRHRHGLHLWIEDLPHPGELGPYSAHVAWVAPLTLDSLVSLGEVVEGANPMGEVALNKYLILVTAEANGEVQERRGPMVLRGRSPSSRMEAHDLTALAPAAELAPPSTGAGFSMQMEGAGADARQVAAGEAGPPGEAAIRLRGGWQRPPLYPGIPMLAGIMRLSPSVSPFLPGPAGSDIGLPDARPPDQIELPNGGTLDLEAGFARFNRGGLGLNMMAFNGQIPGPLVRVEQHATIFVNFTNNTPIPTAVHWHGLRLDNRFDGVPGLTQDPVPPGGSFRYRLHFPDAGTYWYHPHHREDVMQELGLSGNMLVDSPNPEYYGPADRDLPIILDDVLVDGGELVHFGEQASNYALMGRFGNVILLNGAPSYGPNGEPSYELRARGAEVVRLHFTNASNTRTFNLSFQPRGATERPLPLKVVASDLGRFERESFAESVVLAPAERYVVEVLFEGPDTVDMVNWVQGINHREGVFKEEVSLVGSVVVEAAEPGTAFSAGAGGSVVSQTSIDAGEARPSVAVEPGASAAEEASRSFHSLRENRDVVGEIDRYRPHFERPVDHELVLTLEAGGVPMAVEQAMLFERAYANPVEWTGTMSAMNWASTGDEVSWILRDAETGAENDEIDWSFSVGDVIKLRLVNDRWAFHAMQHPLHIHGQRFLVVEQDGVHNENMVWKDTVLLPAGSTTDILLELSNPGRWMVHCHIAEHLESGMSFVFEVEGDA